MAISDIAGKVSNASRAADAVFEEYSKKEQKDRNDLTLAIKQYIAVKLRLPAEEFSDNITKMVRFSISRNTGIPIEELKEMDRPGACGSAPAVLAKRILLFLDVQKKLGVHIPPENAGKIQTIQDLASELAPLVFIN